MVNHRTAKKPDLLVSYLDWAVAALLEHGPPPSRTKWIRRVPHPVLIGHAASLSQGCSSTRSRSSRCSASWLHTSSSLRPCPK